MLKKFFIWALFILGSLPLNARDNKSLVVFTRDPKAKCTAYKVRFKRPGEIEMPWFCRFSHMLKREHLIPAGDKGLRVKLPGYCKFVISAIGSDIFTFGFLTKRQIGLEMPSDRMPDRIAGHVEIKWDREQLNNGKP